MFLLAMAVGVGFVLFKQKTFVRKVLALAPFGVDVFKWGFDLQRVLSLPVYVWGLNKSAAVYLPLVELIRGALVTHNGEWSLCERRNCR
ncbi:hypothetical protein [Paraburkholderia sp. JPY419]|uniref:hypothetical protein n=1 Tax=Paraburkholderia sp. JPY419 TaxID=667660 RepID=UPI003D1DDE88